MPHNEKQALFQYLKNGKLASLITNFLWDFQCCAYIFSSLSTFKTRTLAKECVLLEELFINGYFLPHCRSLKSFYIPCIKNCQYSNRYLELHEDYLFNVCKFDLSLIQNTQFEIIIQENCLKYNISWQLYLNQKMH